MANVVDPNALPVPRPGARPKYPWPEWTDGQWREAVKGTDYTTSTDSFRSAIYYHASTYGYGVKTRLTPGGIMFRFTPAEEADSA